MHFIKFIGNFIIIHLVFLTKKRKTSHFTFQNSSQHLKIIKSSFPSLSTKFNKIMYLSENVMDQWKLKNILHLISFGIVYLVCLYFVRTHDTHNQIYNEKSNNLIDEPNICLIQLTTDNYIIWLSLPIQLPYYFYCYNEKIINFDISIIVMTVVTWISKVEIEVNVTVNLTKFIILN